MAKKEFRVEIEIDDDDVTSEEECAQIIREWIELGSKRLEQDTEVAWPNRLDVFSDSGWTLEYEVRSSVNYEYKEDAINSAERHWRGMGRTRPLPWVRMSADVISASPDTFITYSVRRRK